MKAPSFRCTGGPDGAIILHYYSDRPGLESIVIGIVKVSTVVTITLTDYVHNSAPFIIPFIPQSILPTIHLSAISGACLLQYLLIFSRKEKRKEKLPPFYQAKQLS